MQIALVQCPGATVRFPPLSLACLSAVLKSHGHDVHCFDLNIEAFQNAPPDQDDFWSEDHSFWETIPYYQEVKVYQEEIQSLLRLVDGWARRILNEHPRIVGMSVSSASLWMSRALAQRIKETAPDATIVFGGTQILMGEDLDRLIREGSVDYFVMGEGEQTLLELVTEIDRNHTPQKTPGLLFRNGDILVNGGMPPPIMAIDSLPIPDFTDFDRRNYTHSEEAPILATRGCPNRCTFCNDHYVWQHPPRMRSAESIFREMAHRVSEGYSHFYFTDLLLNMRVKTLVQLSDLIRESPWRDRIRLWGMFVIHRAMTEEVFRIINKMGFIDVQFGIDSGSQTILDRMAKNYTVQQAEEVLQAAWKVGIHPHGDLIIGFPGETEETIRETMDFLERSAPNRWKINTLHSFYIRSGSPVAQDLASFGIEDNSEPNDWTSTDGKNNIIWRLQKVKQVYDHARSLGYPIEYNPIHRYYRVLGHHLHVRHPNQELFDLFYELTEWCTREIEQYKKKIHIMERERMKA